jgi:GH35 family endo-1,4-beta-xylanase
MPVKKSFLAIFLCSILLTGCSSATSPADQDDTNWQDTVLPAAPSDVAQRIEDNRTRTISLELRDREGNLLPEGTEIHVSMTRHEFLFGCNVFNLFGFSGNTQLRQKYAGKFSDLFNFATVPFYWGWYEWAEGEPDVLTRTREMAAWCADHNITPKGHPLIWHESFPDWAADIPAVDFEGRLQTRVTDIVGGFADDVGMFDVINESTVSANFNNRVGDWVESLGSVEAARRGFVWSAGANPDAFLLINDYNVSGSAGDAYHDQITGLMAAGVTPDAIGLQSHMHHGVWSDSDIWAACEKFADIGLPLHFTELTILSGALMAADDWDYATTRTDWNTTAAGEAAQAEDAVRIYRLLFSHPSVGAITWWDFSDDSAWMGAPAGLIRKDLTSKPAYNALMKLIHDEWWTDLTLTVDAAGRVSFRGFYGDYRVTSGEDSSDFVLSRETLGPVPVSF